MVMQVSSVHSKPSINSCIPMTLDSVQTQVWLNLLQLAFCKCSSPLLIFGAVDTWSCSSDPKHSNLQHQYLVHSSGIEPRAFSTQAIISTSLTYSSYREQKSHDPTRNLVKSTPDQANIDPCRTSNAMRFLYVETSSAF